MLTTQQIAGQAIQQATAGSRNVTKATREKFTEAVADLRGDLGDDAVFEFCLGEIVRQVNAQLEAEWSARPRSNQFLDYNPEPAAPVVNSKFFE